MSTDALSSCLEDLVKFSSINSRAIDANVVAFLKDVGIPFYFGLKFDPWALLYNNSVNELLMFNNLSYLVIWKGVLGVNICLSQENQGIYCIDDTGSSEFPITFVNSNINKCSTFICLLNRLYDMYDVDVDYATRKKLYLQIKDQMYQLDIQAFAAEINWWSAALYDLEPLD